MIDARIPASVITETTDVIDRPFDWEREYGAIYRACPDAFWLAPDGQRSMAVPGAVGTPRPSPAPAEPSSYRPASSQVTGVGMALLAAGPTFCAAALAIDTAHRGARVTEVIGTALASLFVAPVTMIVGVVLGVGPIAIGSIVMRTLGAKWRWARSRASWTAAGVILGCGIAGSVGATEAVPALLLTSGACALLARYRVTWPDAAPVARGATARYAPRHDP